MAIAATARANQERNSAPIDRELGRVVPRKGLEPSRPLSHWHLKPARLPIPPPGHGGAVYGSVGRLSNRGYRFCDDFSAACRKILPLFRTTDDTLYSGAAMAGVSSPDRVLGLHLPTGTTALRNHVMASNQDTLVTVFGGSGFVGRNVVRALAKRDYRIRVAGRRPALAGPLQPLGRVGQIHTVQANLRYPASVEAAMRDSHVAINLCGILTESGAQTFDAAQAQGAPTVAKSAAAVGARMVHVSAIGADAQSPSRYGRAKAAGE